MGVSPETIKSTLSSRLQDMVEARRTFLSHGHFLTCLGVKVSYHSISLSNSAESVAANYIGSVCEKMTNQFANGTPAKIELDRKFYTISELRADNKALSEMLRTWDNCDGKPELEQEQAFIGSYLGAVDFVGLAAEINRQAGELGQSGLTLFAYQLIKSFCLNSLDGYYAPSRKGRQIICQTYSVSYHDSFSKTPEIWTLNNALVQVQQDTGVSFGTALIDYINGLRGLSWSCEKIPSRTVYGKGGNLEIHCFKDKHEFRLTDKAFDAILAFLVIHGNPDKVDAIQAFAKRLETA